MKKRLKKKLIKKRYDYGIELLSNYCELPKKIIIQEVKNDLWEVAKNFNNKEHGDDLYPFLDSVSIGLMWKYGTGWAGSKQDDN